MTKKIVALCTEDVRYMKAFASYAERNEADRLMVKTFGDVKDLDEYLNGNRVDVVLIGSEYRESVGNTFGKKLFVLSDDKYVHAGEDNCIFRYQIVDEVVKQLCRSCADDEYVSCAGKRETEFIVIMSPCYPLERETYSREFASCCSKSSRVLYVDFAPFTACENGNIFGLSEAFYYMGEGSKKLKEKIWELTTDCDNYKMISGVKNYRDLYGITEEEVTGLLDCIADIDEYDKVVFDVGHVGDALYPLFDRCTQIVVPVMDKDNPGTAHFMGDFLAGEWEKYADKVSYIHLPDWWNVGSEMRHKWIVDREY